MTISRMLCCCGVLVAAPLVVKDAAAQEPGAVMGQVLGTELIAWTQPEGDKTVVRIARVRP